ncbi:FixH family protein [Hydrogenimonas sp.]
MDQNRKDEINYWPYAIVGMILTVVLLGIWTIKVAVSNPVQLDNNYMMDYQDVDENINEILAQQKVFDSKYRVDMTQNRLKKGENRVIVALTDINGDPVDGAEIIAIVARPTTLKGEKKLGPFKREERFYVSDSFVLEHGGRWNIQVKIKVGNDIGYKTYKTFVKS